ncbi:hypothetical protein CAPTEDRAFT_102896 [Capitella teleta]|uniref:SET domain-containing protein n=1 Tax=Capitella teleta TaxID=283909 RepID=R7UZA0_CAPTE|nr:hypothetical protein CAPTEDRAFT_102896 [Capitella teleta]|eukprot:ELU11903.1 hypothetical protein CAPTEDRAFT_102896 [Capitella teleta]
MLREQYDKENLFFTTLHPFVLFYSKFDGFDLCIDASAYGSDARCVRRSCCPNAEVRHFIQGADIHFFIYSTEQLNCADEVTIPFDFHYQRWSVCTTLKRSYLC